MKYLLTGVAGFIGSQVSLKLLGQGHTVVGIDNINDYYDPKLKSDRLNFFKDSDNFTFLKADVTDRTEMKRVFSENDFDYVIHLAAQAGVRHSLTNPEAYIDTNLRGFLTILEGCRNSKVKHLIYASSSSVYGANVNLPFSVSDNVDHPVSLYAATKKSNELMAHSYSHLYGLPTTGLRFFTVYGPWGRPDMALFLFTKNILTGKPIDVFNNGNHLRDFTFIDDIVEGVIRTSTKIPVPSAPAKPGEEIDPSSSHAPYSVFNIGNNNPVTLMEFIHVIEKTIGMKAEINYLPLQNGDVEKTYANIEALEAAVNFTPSTLLVDGIEKFFNWYKNYYGL